MKITDIDIIQALKEGKHIRLPEFTSNDEFMLADNGISITTAGRIFATGKMTPIPLQINFLERNDWEIVE